MEIITYSDIPIEKKAGKKQDRILSSQKFYDQNFQQIPTLLMIQVLTSEDSGQPLEADEEAGSPNEEAGAPEGEAEETQEANQEQLEEENIHEGNLTI